MHVETQKIVKFLFIQWFSLSHSLKGLRFCLGTKIRNDQQQKRRRVETRKEEGTINYELISYGLRTRIWEWRRGGREIGKRCGEKERKTYHLQAGQFTDIATTAFMSFQHLHLSYSCTQASSRARHRLVMHCWTWLSKHWDIYIEQQMAIYIHLK